MDVSIVSGIAITNGVIIAAVGVIVIIVALIMLIATLSNGKEKERKMIQQTANIGSFNENPSARKKGTMVGQTVTRTEAIASPTVTIGRGDVTVTERTDKTVTMYKKMKVKG